MVDGQAIPVSASIGFAVFPLAGTSGGETFDAAFALVDAAMYHSKAQGRDCATRVLSVDPRLSLEPSSLPTALAEAAQAGHAVLEVHRPAEEFAPA
jgi:predicted signal transduction protein with EAL and GGDEF domain